MTLGTDNEGSDQLQSSDNGQQNVCLNSATYDDEDNRLNKKIVTHSKSVPFTRKFWARILRNFLRKCLRGYAGGVVLYAGVRLLAALLRNPFRKKLPNIVPDVLSKDCIRLASFCALYPSLYQLLVEVLGALQKRRNGWTYGISGGLAGLSIAVLDKSRRQTVSFFTLSRALGAGISTLVSRGHVSAIPFAEVALFSACSSLILYGMVLKPQYLNQGYYRSLLKWSRDYTDAVAQHVYRDPGPLFVTCQEGGIHKSPCVQHALVDFLRSLPGFAKLYLPIHVAPVVVFKRKIFMEKPLYVMKSLAKNMVWSTLFLGALVGLCKFNICILRSISKNPPPLPAYIPLVGGSIGGLSILFERKSRRQELCLFVIPQVLAILYNIAKSSKLWPYLRLPHGFTIMFALSMMSVMHAYEREPESLTMLVKGVLKFFVGPRSRTHSDTL